MLFKKSYPHNLTEAQATGVSDWISGFDIERNSQETTAIAAIGSGKPIVELTVDEFMTFGPSKIEFVHASVDKPWLQRTQSSTDDDVICKLQLVRNGVLSLAQASANTPSEALRRALLMTDIERPIRVNLGRE